MPRKILLTTAPVIVLCCASVSQAQWSTFANETATRMPTTGGLNTPGLSTTDPEEKDYAWGDVDQDGDIDLVCVRKQPFTSTGRKPNVLFMNEGIAEGHSINGVLVDRTAQYASASLAGAWDDPQNPAGLLPDQGFLTWTNDRDVVLTDVNNDGWLDIVTAVTLSDGAPKWISHPRIYMNLGEVKGAWQGFRYEPDRIPNLVPPPPTGVNQNATPRFCSVAAGDVTGDGYPDLYFGDYDSGGAELFDFNNKLLINRGAAGPGIFDDSGTSRISAAKLNSAFGAASVMADMNGDGSMDIIKQSSLSDTHAAIHHNTAGAGIGTFPDATYERWSTDVYFVSAGDLNNDGRLDMVFTKDSDDQYFINTGNNADGTAAFTSFTLGSPSNLFGSQSVIVDLDHNENDPTPGFADILIADVDVDISGCGRRAHIYRNFGGPPNVNISEQTPTFIANGQPVGTEVLTGTHNIAVFDLDGDGWKDIILGRCSGTSVWRQVPPTGIAFTYPQGLPAYLTPGQPTNLNVQLAGISGAQVVANSARMFYSIDGAAFTQTSMTPLGGNLYATTLPAADCPSRVRFYFSADYTHTSGNGTKFDPPNAPTASYLAVAAIGAEISFEDTIEGSVAGWQISNGPGLTAGTWEQATPNPTAFNGVFAAPTEDDTGGLEFTKAFVTLNGPPGDFTAGSWDIDGGATMLVSPVIDLANSDGTVSYSRWFYSSLPGNSLKTEVSNNNGGSWVTVDTVTATIATPGTGETTWQAHSFVVGQYVPPTAQVRLRFTANGAVTNSVAEAGIDNLRVEKVLCVEDCPGDTNNSGSVDVDDLIAVILGWGCTTPPGPCPADVNHSGVVDVDDLIAVILGWGACP